MAGARSTVLYKPASYYTDWSAELGELKHILGQPQPPPSTVVASLSPSSGGRVATREAGADLINKNA
jgi:hypothetical protein